MRKLQILLVQLENKDISSFKRTQEVFKNDMEEKLCGFATLIRNIIEEYNNRFTDFSKIENLIELHNNPFACEILNQIPEIREEQIS